MEWYKIEDVKRADVMNRNDLINKLREAGVELTGDEKVAVGLTDQKYEVCYAIDTDHGFVFWEDGLFIPENREELEEVIAAVLGSVTLFL